MELTRPQSDIFVSPERFRVVVAGRRFGKTFLSTAELLHRALRKDDQNVWYVAPTYKAAKEIAWDMLSNQIPPEYISKTNETSLTINFKNGSSISLKGAEKPDNLRGRSLDFVVLDEFADMRKEAWFEVIRPSLSDRKGGALFIGTPKGRNHFYDLYGKGVDDDEGWKSYQYTTIEGVMSRQMRLRARELTSMSVPFSKSTRRNSSITRESFTTRSSVRNLSDDTLMTVMSYTSAWTLT